MFGETLFGNSRFIFWCVGPILIVVGLALFFLPLITQILDPGDFGVSLLISSAGLFCLSLALGVYDSVRYNWAARFANGYVALAVIGLFVWAPSKSEEPFELTLGYVWGFIFFLLTTIFPCTWYAIRGRFPFSATADDPYAGWTARDFIRLEEEMKYQARLGNDRKVDISQVRPQDKLVDWEDETSTSEQTEE